MELADDHMTVTWRYTEQSLRRKSSANVSVVIFYQSDGGVESRYPPEGSLAANEQQATIHGEFHLDVKYNVRLKMYEGQSVVSSPKTPSVEAQVQRPGKIVKLSCQYIFFPTLFSILLYLFHLLFLSRMLGS